jgi:hypothetical protein
MKALVIVVVIIVAIVVSATSYVLLNQYQTPSSSNQITISPNPSPTTSSVNSGVVIPTLTPTLKPTIIPTVNPTTNPTITSPPTTTPKPTTGLEPVSGVPSFDLIVDNNGYGTSNYTCWISVRITPLQEDTVGAYVIDYKMNKDTVWSNVVVSQGSIIIVKTPNLLENTKYDVRVAGVSHFGDIGTFSEAQSITTLPNNVPYPAP